MFETVKKRHQPDVITPMEHCGTNVKAIVLGTDPTTNGNLTFNKVFDIGGDKRYFSSTNKNLFLIFTDYKHTENYDILDLIYAQNLCPDYLEYSTNNYKRNAWVKFVLDQGYISELREKLDQKFSKNIPVFLTASYLLYALIKPDSKSCSRKIADYYSGASNFITPENSELNRTLIPLSRHHEYSLIRQKEYLNHIRNYLDENQAY